MCTSTARGEVYRARDTKLDRDVAIKILPDHLAAEPERIARFERRGSTRSTGRLLLVRRVARRAAVSDVEKAGGSDTRDSAGSIVVLLNWIDAAKARQAGKYREAAAPARRYGASVKAAMTSSR
jgi:hypothetical protein